MTPSRYGLLLTALALVLPTPAAAHPGHDTKATILSREWQENADIVEAGSDGAVVFYFGVSQPTIVCSPLQLCDLELEAGEKVQNVNVGDSVRWKFDAARSGANGAIPHIIIKPVAPGLSTSVVITTDRRTYHIALQSDADRYMARTKFDYSRDPGNVVAKLALTETEPADEPDEGHQGSIEDLDFNYRVKGSAPWKPLRVFNDGVKTYIEMPDSFRQREAPVLLVLNEGGEQALVNYRIKDNRYIVDQIFDKAHLIAGVGRNQTKVTLTYRTPGASISLVSGVVKTRDGQSE